MIFSYSNNVCIAPRQNLQVSFNPEKRETSSCNQNRISMTFQTFNFHPKILKALEESGYTEPTEVQLKAMPKIMQGFDIRASAQTGTGKTGAFLLPALHRLTTVEPKPGKGPRILVLVPTRELAMQVETQAQKYGKYLNRVKTVSVVGGVPYPIQLSKLSQPYEILIATPGRLIDFLDKSKIHLNRLEMVVLDEADRMLDMGFLEPVELIVSQTPEDRQTLMFSATLERAVLELSEKLLRKPMDIVVHAKHAKNENIQQMLHIADDLGHKHRLLEHILNKVDRAIIFTSTKRHAEELAVELQDKGHEAGALHGDMTQRARTRTIADLRAGKINILVATDVAARGIDVQLVSHVINFDLPRNAEDYVHRIGRTGRAGAKGMALSLASRSDTALLKKIEAFTGHAIELGVIPGLEPRSKKSDRPSMKPHNKHQPWQRTKKPFFKRQRHQ